MTRFSFSLHLPYQRGICEDSNLSRDFTTRAEAIAYAQKIVARYADQRADMRFNSTYVSIHDSVNSSRERCTMMVTFDGIHASARWAATEG